MLVGIMGKMGAGKTLTANVLGTFLHKKTGIPLFTNQKSLENATQITSLSEIWAIDSGILIFDEMWLTMDSRLWKDNVELSRWINQTRKKKLLVIYTTQHINQIELRARKATDVLIYCQRKNKGKIILQFIDYQYQQMGRRYALDDPSLYYHLYDTFEVLQPIKMGKQNKKEDWA